MSEPLRSELLDGLGVRHGFSVRTGGATVADDGQRLIAGLVGAHGTLFQMSQVHGDGVRRLAPADDAVAVRALDGDALIGVDGAAVGVRVADCLAVLVVDPASGAVAAIHAGWRGTVRGIVPRAIGELATGGAEPERFAAALFPHLRACCFEVGEDVAAEIALASTARDVIVRGRAKPHVNLATVVRAQLLDAGLAPARIDDVAGCTRCEPARFFSYRRDGADAGRHLAAIVSR